MIDGTDKPVKFRFPPSPTGHLHLGNVRSALFNWLCAKKYGGGFVLRIEDTDPERSKKEYEIEIVEILKWLGLNWTEGVDWEFKDNEWEKADKGENGPYRQSERTDIYIQYLEKLLSEKKAYFCYCTKEELAAEKQALEAKGLPVIYSGRCRDLETPPEDRKPQLIRFRTPATEIEFDDLIRGKVKFDTGLFGDMVIARDLTSPLYNFAVVIDDHLMGVTHVVRGEEHLANTPKQILISKALGFPEPIYGHLPLILGDDRAKLSKRSGKTSMFQYREDGYLPEALINFLVLLGWHPSGDQEIFTIDELVKEFDLKRVQKAGAVFNPDKLDWINSQYIKRLSDEELKVRIKPFLDAKGYDPDPKMLNKLIVVEKERMKKLSDFVEDLKFFFDLPDYQPELLVWKKDSLPIAKEYVEKLIDLFERSSADIFENKEAITSELDSIVPKEGKGSVYWPLRVALSGLPASPDPVSIAEILGKDEVLKRLHLALNKLNLAI